MVIRNGEMSFFFFLSFELLKWILRFKISVEVVLRASQELMVSLVLFSFSVQNLQQKNKNNQWEVRKNYKDKTECEPVIVKKYEWRKLNERG